MLLQPNSRILPSVIGGPCGCSGFVIHTSSRSLRIRTRVRGEAVMFDNMHTDGRR